ncbi:MAG: 30S ribosomal protein S7 [Candidatus Aenigmatarchaeota archaeon]|nr:30S ribosomal protein S7 [Candidatus Aenigmarchaeota archaeon]
MTEIKLFNKWSTSGITVTDPGLKNYINLKQVIVPRSRGRSAAKQFHKSNMHIVERLATHMFVPGHRGKKHLLTSGACVGKTITVMRLIEDAFGIIEQKTKANPIEVLVRAIENAALREEITSFQVGGIMVRRAVISSPQRRVDLALRMITQGAYQKSVGKPKTMAQALADEIIAAYNYDAQNSIAVREKERIEREAAGAR